jgi:hypothetical protein
MTAPVGPTGSRDTTRTADTAMPTGIVGEEREFDALSASRTGTSHDTGLLNGHRIVVRDGSRLETEDPAPAARPTASSRDNTANPRCESPWGFPISG